MWKNRILVPSDWQEQEGRKVNQQYRKNHLQFLLGISKWLLVTAAPAGMFSDDEKTDSKI